MCFVSLQGALAVSFSIFGTSFLFIDSHFTCKFFFLNAVKCNLSELTTKNTCVPLIVSIVDTYAHMSEFQVLVDRSVAYIQEAFSGVFVVASHCPGSPPPPLPFPPSFTVSTVWRGPVLLTVWGLMVGLPGFPSYGSSLHLGGGWQKWKFLDLAGTQLPF